MLHLSLQLTLGQVLYAVGEQETSVVRVEVAAGVVVNALQHKLILHLEQICAHPIITVGDAAKDTQLGLPLLGQHRVGALQRKAYTCSQSSATRGIHGSSQGAIGIPLAGGGFVCAPGTLSIPNTYKLIDRWHVGADRKEKGGVGIAR